MSRIIVTVLLGFLQFGTLTSVLVFIYVFGANAFFLVSLLLLSLHPIRPLLPPACIPCFRSGLSRCSQLHIARPSLSLFLSARYRSLAAAADSQLRSLKYVLLPDPVQMPDVATLSHSQRQRRIHFLLLMAMSQLLWMGWLSRV